MSTWRHTVLSPHQALPLQESCKTYFQDRQNKVWQVVLGTCVCGFLGLGQHCRRCEELASSGEFAGRSRAQSRTNGTGSLQRGSPERSKSIWSRWLPLRSWSGAIINRTSACLNLAHTQLGDMFYGTSRMELTCWGCLAFEKRMAKSLRSISLCLRP